MQMLFNYSLIVKSSDNVGLKLDLMNRNLNVRLKTWQGC